MCRFRCAEALLRQTNWRWPDHRRAYVRLMAPTQGRDAITEVRNDRFEEAAAPLSAPLQTASARIAP